MDVFYIYQGPGTLGRQKQINDLRRAGFEVEARTAFIDVDGERSAFRDLIGDDENPPMLGQGHVLRLACHAYIANGGRARRAALIKLADLGCKVAVLDGEPVLYDNRADIEEFLKIAAGGAQSEAGKATRGAGKGRGRPAHLWPTIAEYKMVLRQWRDPRYTAQPLIDMVAEMTVANGFPSPQFKSNAARWDAMRSLFGARDDKSEKPVPGRLKDEYPARK